MDGVDDRLALNRRDALKMSVLLSSLIALAPPGAGGSVHLPLRSAPMTIACFIHYQIDPFQRDAFKTYAASWGRIIPRCGGHLIGYFLPHEGTNDVGWGLIAFESLAAYELYRARIKTDPEGRDNFAFAQSRRFIIREERTFVEIVDGTFELPSTLAAPSRRER